jgi:hypothetical protein
MCPQFHSPPLSLSLSRLGGSATPAGPNLVGDPIELAAMKGKVETLYLTFSICLPLSHSLYLSFSLSFFLTLSHFLYLSFSLSFSFSIPLTLSLSHSHSLYLISLLSLTFSLSLSLTFYLSISYSPSVSSSPSLIPCRCGVELGCCHFNRSSWQLPSAETGSSSSKDEHR